jgi:cell division protein FtsB
MRFKKKQKKFVKILSSKVFLFFLILLSAGVIKLTIEKYTEVSKARATLKTEKQKIEEGEKKTEEMKAMLKYLTSKEYIESIAKKKLNMVKQGEKVIYVLPEKIEKKEKKEKKKSFWENVKDKFNKKEEKE